VPNLPIVLKPETVVVVAEMKFDYLEEVSPPRVRSKKKPESIGPTAVVGFRGES